MTSPRKIIQQTIQSEKFLHHSKTTTIRDLTGDLEQPIPPIDGLQIQNCKNQTLQSLNTSVYQRINSFIQASNILLDNHFANDPVAKEKYRKLLAIHINKLKTNIDSRNNNQTLSKHDLKYTVSHLTDFINKSTKMSIDESFKALLDAENINSWQQKKDNLITVYKTGHYVATG